MGTTLSDFNGDFRIRTRGKPGRYRATAVSFSPGTPPVTRCSTATWKIVRIT
jgi:hypothetical protein